MKNILHRINTFLCILLVAAGIAILVNAGNFMENTLVIIYVASVFQIIMALVVLLIGTLMPKEDRILSKRSRFFLRLLLLAAAVSGKAGTASSAMDVTDGNVKVRRSWEPTIVFVWIIFQSVFSIFCFQGNIRIHLLVILSLVCLVALLITELWWKILDEKERGTYRLSKILLPMIAVFVLLAVCGIYAAWSEESEDRLIPDLSDLRKDVEDSQQKIDDYATKDPFLVEDSITIDLEEFQETFEQITDVSETDDQNVLTSGMSSEQLVQQICMDFYPADVYYKLMKEEDVYIVAWSEDSDDIVIYQIAQQEDGYTIVTAFISSALTKEDVNGKEDGVWHVE